MFKKRSFNRVNQADIDEYLRFLGSSSGKEKEFTDLLNKVLDSLENVQHTLDKIDKCVVEIKAKIKRREIERRLSKGHKGNSIEKC